ncbi:WYL domain-containing protein [Kitasatospora sp. NPDC086009]|uniref:WYL domain-containing protein n=1 Tax=unclassified Kitasatospora TaxID=2633591 RepID=UPI0037C86AF3
MIQTTTAAATSTRLIKAMDRQHPVTISYTKENGDHSVRTIEIYDFTVSKAGDVLVKAMDRATGESRSFRLDRISAITVHRTAYRVELTDSAKDAPAAPTLNHPGDPVALLLNPDITSAELADPVALLADLLSH